LKRLRLTGCVATLALCGSCAAALAQAWPQRPIRLVVPFAAGGNTDNIARLTADQLARTLGQVVVVDNKPGGNGIIAADLVAKAPADGYTLLMAPMPLMAVLPAVTRVAYDPIRDYAPVSNIGSNPFVLAIHASVPARTVGEFVAYIKEHPGKFNYASGGAGSVSHLSSNLFLRRAGLDMIHVSYKGGAPALADLLGGQVQMYFGNLSELAPHAQSGRIRIIGVSGARRASQLPEVPTIAESGYPGFHTVTWNGLVAPAGTPAAAIARLAKDAQAICAAPDAALHLNQIGVDPLCSTPAEFAATIKSDIAAWADAVRAADLKIE
jgi:tripartite-type tricarboxylate transporter receptor subunit TctC